MASLPEQEKKRGFGIHKHIGVKGWCDCSEFLNDKSTLSCWSSRWEVIKKEISWILWRLNPWRKP